MALLTPEEYLRMEREAPHKSEYHDGEVFSMAGGFRGWVEAGAPIRKR